MKQEDVPEQSLVVEDEKLNSHRRDAEDAETPFVSFLCALCVSAVNTKVKDPNLHNYNRCSDEQFFKLLEIERGLVSLRHPPGASVRIQWNSEGWDAGADA